MNFRERFLKPENRETAEEVPSRIEAVLSEKNLVHNYDVIRDLARGQSLIPMIKADGYGHGMIWAGKILARQKDLYALGVATLDEGVRLRENIGMKFRKTPILVFSGGMPFSDTVGGICEQNGLTPVIASDEDWARFIKGKWPGKIPYEIKFNTGMNRLGVSVEFVSRIRKDLSGKNPEAFPQGILSHFAMSDQKDAALTRTQIDRFLKLRKEMATAFPQAHFHMANSGAIWNLKNLGLDLDAVRPGISLYGATPWAGAPLRDLRPVMSLRAKVLSTRALKLGDTVGYNATYKVLEKNQHMAILGVGYGDGLHRSLSNKGKVEVGGFVEPILGIVSMDLTAVRCTAKTKAGDWAEVFGRSVTAWDVALAAGTIPYEVFTSLTSRVRRIYKDE